MRTHLVCLPICSCIIVLHGALPAAAQNPYGVAGYISSTNLANHGFPPGMNTYDWNNLRTDLKYQMVRPFHYWYRHFVPGGNYVTAWFEHDVPNRPEAWFTQQSYPTDTPWNIRQGFNLMMRRPQGYHLDRAGGNMIGQLGLPPDWLPQWYLDQGGNHQERFNSWISANPGKTWLMGNEPGGFENVWELKGQDALTAREYAIFYRTFYDHILSLDPGARFANAGLAMTTVPTWSPELPVESVIEIWESILDHYHDLYDEEMPVDVWNIHLYAGHGAQDPEIHRAKYVETIETFRDFVDTTRGGLYQDAPLILTEFNGTYDASGFTRENVVAFLNDFRDDLNNMWVRGVLSEWFWFVSSGGDIWPAVSIRDGANLTIVGEAYRDAAWHWEALKPPLHEDYGTSGQPFHADNGGLWRSDLWSDGAGDNLLAVNEDFADYARLTLEPGSGTAAERTLIEDRHLAGLGTFSFLEGEGAGIAFRFAPAGSGDADLFVGYAYGEGGPDDGQSGLILRAEGGATSNVTVRDAVTGDTLAVGVDLTLPSRVFFVVNAARDIDVYLNDTTGPLATLGRMSTPDTDQNRLRIGSNSAEVAGQGRFRGTVDVYTYVLDDAMLDSAFAEWSPVILKAGLSTRRLLANDLAIHTATITAVHHNGLDRMHDMRFMLHDAAPLAPERGRGYLAWGASDAEITHTGGQWTLADADGGGRWGWRADDWGADQYITPLGASTSVTGNQRTVTFSFIAQSHWATVHGQRLFMSIRDHLEPVADWALIPEPFSVVRIDLDGDGDVDMSDFGYLQACLSGTGVAQSDPDCAHALLDDDTDVDAQDVSIFLGCLSGAGVPVAPDCAD